MRIVDGKRTPDISQSNQVGALCRELSDSLDKTLIKDGSGENITCRNEFEPMVFRDRIKSLHDVMKNAAEHLSDSVKNDCGVLFLQIISHAKILNPQSPSGITEYPIKGLSVLLSKTPHGLLHRLPFFRDLLQADVASWTASGGVAAGSLAAPSCRALLRNLDKISPLNPTQQPVVSSIFALAASMKQSSTAGVFPASDPFNLTRRVPPTGNQGKAGLKPSRKAPVLR